MSNRFVRSSKFRHVFGTPYKRELCYDNIKVTKHPNESNMCAVNGKFIAVVLESQGGGSFQVMPLGKVGRFDINHPKVCGHKSNVLDIAWNPFNENQIASASEDTKVKIWEIPDEGIKENLEESVKTLVGHNKKVLCVVWHPSAANVLLSAGFDSVIILWNTETGDQLMQCSGEHPDQIQSVSWNYNGSMIATSCKDKMLRVINARTGDVVQQGKGHDGTKPTRVIYCGTTDKLFTTGFSRMSERQYALWDPNNLSKALTINNLDSGSGVLFPFWDESTKMVYVVGKGDTQIKYFEITDKSPFIFFLSMFQSTAPQRGCGLMPKKYNDVLKCEMMRFYKLHTKGLVEPISMAVPRKSEMFQDDIFPPCEAGKPALTAEEWASGTDKDPWLVAFTKDGLCDMSLEESQIFGSKQGKPKTPSASLGPSTLDEYRVAYKKLQDENEKLKKRVAELESK